MPRTERVEVAGARPRPLPVVGGPMGQLLLTHFRVTDLVGLASVPVLLQRVLGRVRYAKELP